MDFFSTLGFMADHVAPFLSPTDLGRLAGVSKTCQSAVELEIENRRSLVASMRKYVSFALTEPAYGCISDNEIEKARSYVNKAHNLMGPRDCPYIETELRQSLSMLPNCFYSVTGTMTVPQVLSTYPYEDDASIVETLAEFAHIFATMHKTRTVSKEWIDRAAQAFSTCPDATNCLRKQVRIVVEKNPTTKVMFKKLLNKIIVLTRKEK